MQSNVLTDDDVIEKIAAMPCISLSIRENDRTILDAFIDRTASQSRIIAELQGILSEFSVPYRDINPRLVHAIRLQIDEGLTFEEASIKAFGTSEHARKIRYWRNRWGMQ